MAGTRFRVGDRVRVKFGVARGHFGTVMRVSEGNDYFAVQLSSWPRLIGFCGYELDLSEPASVPAEPVH